MKVDLYTFMAEFFKRRGDQYSLIEKPDRSPIFYVDFSSTTVAILSGQNVCGGITLRYKFPRSINTRPHELSVDKDRNFIVGITLKERKLLIRCRSNIL